MKQCVIVMLTLLVTVGLGNQGITGAIGGGEVRDFTPIPYADADWIYFSNGIKFSIRHGEPELSPSLKIATSNYYIIHCSGPIYPDHVQALEAQGAKIYFYLPNYAFVVRMNDLTKSEIEKLAFIDWIGIYQPAYKISGQAEFQNLQGRERITILLYPDAEFDGTIEFLQNINARIIDTAESEWDKLIICDVDLSLVNEIAKLEEVSWVEPWHPTFLHNSYVQWILQTCTTNNRRVWDMGIRGDGQLLSTSDSGIRTSHYAFRSTASTWLTTWGDYPADRKIIAYKPANSGGAGYADFGDEGGISYHGTHTAGTITGDDTLNATDLRDGMAIKGRIYFLDGGGAYGGIYLFPNLNSLYNFPYVGNAAGSVKIMSNSWGSDAEGSYDAGAAQSDQFMWNHKDFLLFISNGNNPPNTYVASPASAKNVVSVGSCGNSSQWNMFSTFSARGPADDGRRKPTILAPGSGVSSANGANDNGYWTLSGTSMSSPAAAGAGVLVRQYFTDGWYPSGTPNTGDSIAPSAALIKAMLINSADASLLGHIIPDDFVGWGRIDLDSILYFAGDTKKLSIMDDTLGLLTGQYVEYSYGVVSNTIPLRATLVWTDYAGFVGAGKKLVNDLHLKITDPDANEYLGNVYSGGQSTTGGSADTLNVEECLRRNSPTPGDWTIRIDAVNCPTGPQPFALVVTGDLGPSGITENTITRENNFEIYSAYPNPFHDNAFFAFNLPEDRQIKITVYNCAGQLIRNVIDQKCNSGFSRISWDGKDVSGNRLPDGVYFYSLAIGTERFAGKLILQH